MKCECRVCHRKQNRKYYVENRDAHISYTRRAQLANPAKQMVRSAKSRADREGFPFSITEADIIIPDVCPVLGIKLIPGVGTRSPLDTSPSLDKVVPSLGYVVGNVRVISFKANRIKTDATPDELLAVYRYSARNTPPATQPDVPCDAEPSSNI